MRLNPAVRDALADIVATLNDSTRSPDACKVGEGIFVPLAEFERRGIQPSAAIRALDDTRMLRRPRAGGPPTVSRQIREAPVLGVILTSAPCEAPGPETFALTGEADPVASRARARQGGR